MKARVKETGEIVDAVITQRVTHTGEQVYMTHEGCLIEGSRLDFNVDPIDYWTRLEHIYAGMAMQGILTNPIGFENIRVRGTNIQIETALLASEFAHALVEKYKKEERK